VVPFRTPYENRERTGEQEATTPWPELATVRHRSRTGRLDPRANWERLIRGGHTDRQRAGEAAPEIGVELEPTCEADLKLVAFVGV
jgi:hypothetical protein